MSDSTDDPLSDVVDFVGRFLDDAAAGGPRSLEHYLGRYPGHPAAIQERYVALVEERERSVMATEMDHPEMVGPYRICGRLGVGGQGIVYLAEDQRIGRRVALKVLNMVTLGSAEGRERFRREATVVSRLDHSGLCGIYEAQLEGSVPYIAMRLVEGENLSKRIGRVRESGEGGFILPGSAETVDECLYAFERLAVALSVAHSAGVVHRDIKPGNVMVTPEESLVLLDFGLAHDELPGELVLTRTSQVLGTPAYMAPEQLTPGRQVDSRTDVFALASVLYECLTLVRPFQGVSIEDQCRAILEEPITNPQEHNPSIPYELFVVLEAALSKEPERRYASAEEFAADLRRVRAREPIAALRPSYRYRMAKFFDRNRLATQAAAGVALALILGLVTASYGLFESRIARAEAQSQRATANLQLTLNAAHAGDNWQARRYLELASVSGDEVPPWEFRLAERMLKAPVRYQVPGRVYSIQPCGNGTQLFVGLEEGHCLLDLDTGEFQEVPDVRGSRGNLYAEHSSGEWVAIVEYPGNTLFLYSLRSNEVTWRHSLQSRASGLAFIGDSGLLAVASEWSVTPIQFFDFEAKTEVDAIPGTDAKSRLAYLPDQRRLVGAGASELWSWSLGDAEARTIQTLDRMHRYELALDGVLVEFQSNATPGYGTPEASATRASDGNRRVIKRIFPGKPGTGPKTDVLQLLAKSRIAVVDAWNGHLLGSLEKPGVVGFVSTLGRDNQLFAGGDDGAIYHWDLLEGMPSPASFYPEDAAEVLIAVGGGRAVTAINKGYYVSWGLESLSEHAGGVLPTSRSTKAVAVDSRGEFFATAAQRDRHSGPENKDRWMTNVFEFESGKHVASVAVPSEGVWPRSLAFHPSEEQLAIGYDGGLVEVVCSRTGGDRREMRVEGPAGEVLGHIQALAWSPDGRNLAVGTLDGTVAVLVPATGQILWSAALRHSGGVQSLCFEAGGIRLVSGGADSSIRLWSDEGTRVGETAVGGPAGALAFHPNEPRLAVGSGASVEIVEMSEGQGTLRRIVTLDPSVGTVGAITFLKSGDTLAVVGDSGMRLYEAAAQEAHVAQRREERRRDRSEALFLLQKYGTVPEMERAAKGSLKPGVRNVARIYENPDILNIAAWVDPENTEFALPRAKRAVELGGGRARYHDTLGRVEMFAGNTQAALGHLKKADAIGHDDDPTTVGMAQGSYPVNLLQSAYCHAILGDIDAAEADYAKAEALIPELRARGQWNASPNLQSHAREAIDAALQAEAN